MTKLILILTICFLFPIISFADCRFTTTGASTNWTDPAAWSVTYSSPGPACPSFPSSTSISSGDVVNINHPMNLTTTTYDVNGGGTLNLTTTFTLSGNLTFSNNSTFTSTGSSVLNVTGTLTNNNNSTGVSFNGTVNVTGNVVTGNGSTITGTGSLSATGTITTSGNSTIFGSTAECTVSPCFTSDVSTLPIELIAFYTTNSKELINISWTTASEHNTSYFNLERSREGQYWTLVNAVSATGNSTTSIDYTISDSNPFDGTNYYRLMQYDIDGEFKIYGPISSNFIGNNDNVRIYPNPGNETIYIQQNSKITEDNIEIVITDSKGIEVYSRKNTSSIGLNTFIIDDFNSLPGLYYISIISEVSPLEVTKYIKK